MPDTPYSILTISVLSLFVYGLSMALVRLGIISGDLQRKFWNTLLLLSIAVAGSIGLLLAITVNFKISLPLTSSLLVWHVDFGIALLLIAGFHFLHHFKYYLHIFRKTEITEMIQDLPKMQETTTQPRYQLGFNLKRLPFSLGFTSMATQLILLREFLSVFNGNELTIGIVLANWLLLTGLGSLMNHRSTSQAGLKGIMTGLFLLAVIPVITLFLLYWLRAIVLPVGIQPGIRQILTGTIVLLAPFCLLSGWLFSSVSVYLSNTLKENAVSLTYGWETVGSIVAGILCSMVLVFLFEPFQNMAIVLIINSVILFFISRKEIYGVRKKFHFYLATAIFTGLITLIMNLDRSAMHYLFPDQEIVFFNDTPYGKLVVTEKAGQLNFFDNNTLLFTTNMIITNEETVHYALLQRTVTGNVLLVGGGISGVADECLKYPLKRLDCVEINPRIYTLGNLFNRLPHDLRFKIHFLDARLFLKKSLREKNVLLSKAPHLNKEIDSLNYDAIILNIPGPSTLQINRFYTFEFLSLCKEVLAHQGIISLSLMSTADYVGNDALKIQSTMYQTLKAVFGNVLVIPGEKNYFLASDGPLTPCVAQFGTKMGIQNEYVNEYYLDDVSLQERSSGIINRISGKAPLNLDYEPVGCYRQLHYWFSYQGNFSLMIAGILLLIILFIAGLRATGTTVALFSAGLSSFSLEIILILTYQVIYGYIYLAVGVFITLFMIGLALGVLLAKRNRKKPGYKALVLLQLVSGGIILLSLATIYIFRHFPLQAVLVHVAFGILILGIAMATGVQFHTVTILKPGSLHQVASASYSAELLGSATGALLVTTLVIPFWGFTVSLLGIACFNGFAVLLMLVKKRK